MTRCEKKVDYNLNYHNKLTNLPSCNRVKTKTETKLRGFGPRANHAYQATAACWRSKCQLLRIEGVPWSAQLIPPVVSLGCLDRSRDYIFHGAPQLSSRG
jgi:hypothetical protein